MIKNNFGCPRQGSSLFVNLRSSGGIGIGYRATYTLLSQGINSFLLHSFVISCKTEAKDGEIKLIRLTDLFGLLYFWGNFTN